MRVILRRVAPKGSLSIPGFYGRGAKVILSLALLAQDDARHAVSSHASERSEATARQREALASPQRAKASGLT